MKLLNTVLLLIGLVAFVMYLKNLFDIREGVLTDNRTRSKTRCPNGYKKYPVKIPINTKRNTGQRRQLVGNMKDWRGKPIKGSHYRNLVRRRRLNVYDYECKNAASSGNSPEVEVNINK